MKKAAAIFALLWPTLVGTMPQIPTGSVGPFGAAGVLPTVVQVGSCTGSTGGTCTFGSPTTTGNSVVLFGTSTTAALSDVSAVSGTNAGSLARGTNCNYLGAGTSAIDGWYKGNVTGGDTTITVTAAHGITGMKVFELSHANTFISCLQQNNSVATTVSTSASYAASANQIMLSQVNGMTCDTVNSGALPSAGAWTVQNGHILATAIAGSSATYQFICNNHNAGSSTSAGVSMQFGN